MILYAVMFLDFHPIRLKSQRIDFSKRSGDVNNLNLVKGDGVSVLVVDDHQLVVDTLVAALNRNQDFNANSANDVETALHMIDNLGRYDLVLLDYDIPGMDALRGMHRLIEANDGGVALFSGIVGFAMVDRAISHGAIGFIPKTLSLEALIHAVRIMIAGETYLPAAWFDRMRKNGTNEAGLKSRELQVLELLNRGLQNKEIARQLDLTEVIVKLDVRSICKKLKVRNRTQAVLAARENGLCKTA